MSRYTKVTGDVLLSSGVVAYLGTFTVDFRNVSHMLHVLWPAYRLCNKCKIFTFFVNQSSQPTCRNLVECFSEINIFSKIRLIWICGLVIPTTLQFWLPLHGVSKH